MSAYTAWDFARLAREARTNWIRGWAWGFAWGAIMGVIGAVLTLYSWGWIG
jgi:hypothetical protein